MPVEAEWDIRGVSRPQADGQPSAVVICSRSGADASLLSLNVGPAEAHQLAHELQHEPTPRTRALDFVASMAEALGATIVAARLMVGPAVSVRGALELSVRGETITISCPTGLALAASVGLGVPLIGDLAEVLSESAKAAATSLDDTPWQAFLGTLDLSGLGEHPH